MKKMDQLFRDYVSKLNFDSLRYLSERFTQRVGPDMCEAIEFLSNNTELDKCLASARNYEEFWTMIDLVSSQVEREVNRRFPELAH